MPHLPINILAEWDPEASVWVATTEDIDGFSMEDATIERLIQRAPGVLLDMIEYNHPQLLKSGADIPFEVHAVRGGIVPLSA